MKTPLLSGRIPLGEFTRGEEGTRVPLPVVALICITVVPGATYIAALLTGATTIVGYERGYHYMGVGHSSFAPGFALPVPLAPGEGIRADYRVDARWGSLELAVRPPIYIRPLEALPATALIAGETAGSVMFVAQDPGPHRFETDGSPLGGRRCPGARSVGRVLAGTTGCATYDVRHAVSWRHASAAEVAAFAGPKLPIPRQGDDVDYLYLNRQDR